MVEQSYSDGVARFGEASGEGDVLGARRRVSTRMVVECDEAGRVGEQGWDEEPSWFCCYSVEASLVGDVVTDGSVSSVEEQSSHDFMWIAIHEIVEEADSDLGSVALMGLVVPEGVLVDQGDSISGDGVFSVLRAADR